MCNFYLEEHIEDKLLYINNFMEIVLSG